jgi:crotonobetainyl-CoA:carnitine CoA-transferase CaiB-like acyl-CoA transferase
LADLGADVLKIERPDGGDDTRAWGPPFIAPAAGPDRGDAAYFAAANRSKRSAALDFANPQDAALITRLAERADVLVENFKVGGLAKFGLDYESLAARNRKLVYCSITGFGQFGPYADRPGYDFLIQGMSGLMSITGAADGPPMKVGVAVSDLFTGLYAASAILAALRHAERTGEGQHLDAALLDCQLAALANQAQNYLSTGRSPVRLGNAHPNLTPYGPFQAADGPVIVAVGNDGQFQALCRVLGAPELAADPRFTDNAARLANRDALALALAPLFAGRAAETWAQLLNRAGTPAGPIRSVGEAFEDPHVGARGLLAAVEREDGARFRLATFPVRLSKTPAVPPRPPPRLGADAQAALAEWLGPE